MGLTGKGRNLHCSFLLFVVVLIPTFLLFYAAVFLDHVRSPWLGCPSCSLIASSPADEQLELKYEPDDDDSPTNISHILFGIAGSAETLTARRAYSEVWWRPGLTRGYVWLDKEPSDASSNGTTADAASSTSSTSRNSTASSFPPIRISETVDTSRFGNRVSAVRIARILVESHRLLESSLPPPAVRWLVMGDDDTVFFLENLVATLGRYDHREMYYIGGVSESVEQRVTHGFGTAFGGGGFAVSVPAAREASRVFDGCLGRYQNYWGSDERVRSCLAEVGVPLTVELGFHQLDVRGDPSGILAAHPLSPLLSLHHLDAFPPLYPFSPTQLSALHTLFSASRTDPARTLQQSICYEPRLRWSVSVSWGYTVHIYPDILPPELLTTPALTFRTWTTAKDGPFMFNTRPASPGPCEPPALFFLDRVEEEGKAAERGGLVRKVMMGRRNNGAETAASVTVYNRWDHAVKCGGAEHAKLRKVEIVRVAAAVMDPLEWKTGAPRRQCCEARRSWWGSTIDVRIRRCRPGEAIVPPPSYNIL